MQKYITICMTTCNFFVCSYFLSSCVFVEGCDGKSEWLRRALHFKCALPLCCELEVVFRLRQNDRAESLWFAMVLRHFKLDFTQGWWPLPAVLNNLHHNISKIMFMDPHTESTLLTEMSLVY